MKQADADPDHTKRPEPAELLELVRGLRSEAKKSQFIEPEDGQDDQGDEHQCCNELQHSPEDLPKKGQQ